MKKVERGLPSEYPVSEMPMPNADYEHAGAEFGRQVQAMFEKDLAASNAITLEQWERRGLGPRLKDLVMPSAIMTMPTIQL